MAWHIHLHQISVKKTLEPPECCWSGEGIGWMILPHLLNPPIEPLLPCVDQLIWACEENDDLVLQEYSGPCHVAKLPHVAKQSCHMQLSKAAACNYSKLPHATKLPHPAKLPHATKLYCHMYAAKLSSHMLQTSSGFPCLFFFSFPCKQLLHSYICMRTGLKANFMLFRSVALPKFSSASRNTCTTHIEEVHRSQDAYILLITGGGGVLPNRILDWHCWKFCL